MWLWLLVGYGVSVLLMLTLWFIQRSTQRADLIDIGWTLSILIMAWIAGLTQHGSIKLRIIVMLMGTLWGGRLSYLLFQRLRQTHHEDPRYQELREAWHPQSQSRFFFLFQFQALLVPLLCLPFFLAANRQNTTFDGFTWAAIVLWVIGYAGVALADFQLRQHKRNAPPKTVCERGLWRYSRHPNYFFEWVIWISYFVLGLPHQLGLSGIFAPIIMYIFLRWVTGVPPAEAQSLRRRGEAYAVYQKTTAAFFPSPRRSTE